MAVQSNERSKRLRQARDAYQASLTRLKSSPTDANLREDTLRLGRAYSNLTRDRKGVTVYDEMALMNDINAACAGAAGAGTPSEGTKSVEERLAQLQHLRDTNLISADEYEERRQAILQAI